MDQFIKSEPQVFEFTVNERMVDLFVRLTGDRSSLHTDGNFARRSTYRTKLVHGMLPLMFIAKLQTLGPLSQITAKFLKPVFIGDALRLTVMANNASNAAEAKFDYEIRKMSTDVLVTNGFFITRDWPVNIPASNAKRGEGGMLLGDVDEKEILFEQISKGDQQQMHFCVTKGSCGLLEDMVGAIEDKPGVTHLLASTLLSTMTGVCLPGKWATFIDLNLRFDNPIAQDHEYILKATVGFKSQATRVIVNDVAIYPSENPPQGVASGKMTVKVNIPPTVMPSMEALKEIAGLGTDLKGKVVLVTGASRGIGETTAKLFAAHGARVAVNFYHGQADAGRIVQEIITQGGDAIAVKADVSDRAEVKAMVAAICARYGTIDILVNNAIRDALPISFDALTWADIQQDIDVTIKGAFNCCQEVLPLMTHQRQGKIINMGTIFIDQPVAHQAKYVLTKSALWGLTQSLALEYASFNIQINMLIPTMVDTDLSQGANLLSPASPKVKPVDVAKMIVGLSSPMSFGNGQKIPVI